MCLHLCKQLGRVAAPRRKHQPQRLLRVLVEQRPWWHCCAADRLLRQHMWRCIGNGEKVLPEADCRRM